LTAFLRACNRTTPEGLEPLLRYHLEDLLQEKYSAVREVYAPVQIDLVIYLVDQVVLMGSEIQGVLPDNPPAKIKVIMSAIIWTSKLFHPEWEWQKKLLRAGDRRALKQGLTWLDSIKQRSFVKGEPLGETDHLTLNGLWTSFEQHNERPIQLAFAMAKRGVPRVGSPKKDDSLRTVIHPLIDALKL
jgi:hypothetical protein